MVKFSTLKMLFTKNDSLGIFEMSEDFRRNCETAVESLLTPWIIDQSNCGNPFSLDENGLFKPTFIRLSPACTYYRKVDKQTPMQFTKSERQPQGKCFTGNVAIVLKGVKFTRDGLTVTPIIHVCQVLELVSVPTWSVADVAFARCVLDIDDSMVQPPAPVESCASTQ
jgi:hypothetical protein